ncbi:hypothetical protein BBP40_008340 [Aspergillus hancockii]|nr:hypothetical protein BBP40_008340 [Aspergillus hancockii]
MPPAEQGLVSSVVTAHGHQTTEILGHVRRPDEVTGATLLVSQPSSDPNDGLNWPKPFKIYGAVLNLRSIDLNQLL